MSVGDIQSSHAPRSCSKTGFALIPAAGTSVFRLAKTAYGPLNPVLRPLTSALPRDCWNRYDVAGQRTVYAASTAEGAYGELLAPLKPKLTAPAATYFDDVSPGDDLESLVREEWKSAGHRAPREIDLGWLDEFKLYTLTLPAAGWFIDIEASTSLSAIISYAPMSLVERGILEISVAELRGTDRWLTTAIATRIWQITLDDASLAHGVVFGSRHGSDWNCWAVWLRRVRTGLTPEGLITTADHGRQVLRPNRNQPLATILKIYGLRGT
ncbi:hypothetical protein [Nocardia brasiliensis]|uniref:hypothetical protein n=1 Tax=Nocardia brasiliensis TaxID=37326 RepID=UPI001893D0B0|nr:hypothetical protein [Nocardia brasiliensis]MBF6548833.1 hypothetical protein [Nocardia brasiliensis]